MGVGNHPVQTLTENWVSDRSVRRSYASNDPNGCLSLTMRLSTFDDRDKTLACVYGPCTSHRPLVREANTDTVLTGHSRISHTRRFCTLHLRCTVTHSLDRTAGRATASSTATASSAVLTSDLDTTSENVSTLRRLGDVQEVFASGHHPLLRRHVPVGNVAVRKGVRNARALLACLLEVP